MPARKKAAPKPSKPAAARVAKDKEPTRAEQLENIVLLLARGNVSAAKDAAEKYEGAFESE